MGKLLWGKKETLKISQNMKVAVLLIAQMAWTEEKGFGAGGGQKRQLAKGVAEGAGLKGCMEKRSGGRFFPKFKLHLAKKAT